jgi:putative DNA primase/helicase
VAEGYSISEVIEALRGNIAALAEHLTAGRKVQKARQTIRVGSKGALVIELAGPKRGTWYNHESQTGGGPLELIAHLQGCSRESALEYARAFTGMPEGERGKHRPQATHKPAVAPIPAQAANDRDGKAEAWRAAKVSSLWRGAVPLAGTLGERYLTETRRIPKPSTGWPQAVRYNPSLNAVIVAATTDDGAVQAVQVIRLDRDGRKAEAQKDRPVKQSFGTFEGAAVRLPGAVDGPVLFAEGPETGLSVWAATGYETRVAFGSIAKLAPEAGRLVVACRDDDPAHSPADKAFRRALEAWKQAGHIVTVATPWKQRAQDKSDFNDAMQRGGPQAVAERIQTAINPIGVKTRRVPVDEARAQLDSLVSSFFDTALSHDPQSEEPPPVLAIKAEVGTGKSVAARRHAARLLAALRAAGDGRTVVFAVPTHRLGDEQARAFEALPEAKAAGLVARVWRGMEAPDPKGIGVAMCRNLDAVKDAREVGANPQNTVCKAKITTGQTVKCPFYSACGYQAQRKAEADLWIVAHEILYNKKPTALGDVAAVVVDESAWQDGLIGAHGRHLQLTLDALTVTDPVYFVNDGVAYVSQADTQRLSHLRGELHRALRDSSDGPVVREMLEAHGFTQAMAREAETAEGMRRVDVPMHPLMTKEQRAEAKAGAMANKTLGRFNTLWRAVAHLLADGGPQASGWLELAHDKSDEGSFRVLRLKGRREVAAGFQAPTLIIDATLQLDLIRPIWPGVVLAGEIAVAAPFQHVTQVVDRSYSKRSLEQREDVAEADAKYRANNLTRLHAQLCGMARRYAPGRILIVAQQDTELALERLGNMPGNVEMAHHNAVAGRDEWRDVAALVVVGRTQAPPGAVTRIAEAVTGAHVPLLDGWYPRADAAREMREGNHVIAEADQHPDPIAEAIRWSICEGELVQIIGRGRGVNRTQADPLDVLVMTDAPLPLPLAGTVAAAELHPTPHMEQMAAGGIAFENTAAAATAYPELWPSAEASRKAHQRARCGTSPYNIYLYGNVPDLRLSRITYQPEGAGSRPATAWFDPELVPDPAAWIAARLGPLKTAIIDTPAPAPDYSREDELSRPMEAEPMQAPALCPGPMVQAPPANSWRLKTGAALVERRAAIVTLPTGKPEPGAMVCQLGDDPGAAVAVRWAGLRTYIEEADAAPTPPDEQIAAWVAMSRGELPSRWTVGMDYARRVMRRVEGMACDMAASVGALEFGRGLAGA